MEQGASPSATMEAIVELQNPEDRPQARNIISTMTKSTFAVAVDKVQATLKPGLAAAGFRARGRTFNRQTSEGLTQVIIGIQMGASDPPGTTYIPGLRENLHGKFAVNLGVYVPEVALFSGSPFKAWIQEYDCCARARLGELIGVGK